MMKNFIAQDGCHNCKNVFIRYEYEDLHEYFCVIDAPKRPLCMSVAMNENLGGYGSRIGAYNKWYKWKEGRGVEPWGRCDLYDRQ